MKASLWLILLLGCGCFYLRNQQPQFWNSIVGNEPSSPFATLSPAPKKFFIPPDPYPAQPNWNWTTSEGKSYQNVVIKKVEADCVTVLDENGGARIDIATLPPEIQKQLNYDPELALEASQERSKTEAADTVALEQERQQAAVLQEKEREVEATNSLATASDPGSYPSSLSSPTESSSSSGPVVVDNYDYGQDLILVRRHLHFDPVTGRPDGDPYYLRKYEEDNRALAEKEHRGENAGRTEDHPHEGFPTLTAPTAETARTDEDPSHSASSSTISAATTHASTTSPAKPPIIPPPPRPPPLPKTSS